MSGNLIVPLFGVGPQEVFALIFVLVSVIGWIIRQVQGTSQQMPPPVQRPGRRREERVNDELDSFLQQVNPGQGARPQDPSRPVAASRPKPPGNRAAAAVSQKPAAKPPLVPPTDRPSRRIREESPPRSVKSNLGEGLSQHVREHMGERVANEARRDVGQDVKDSVQKHLGTPLKSSTPGSSRMSTEDLFAVGPTREEAACCGRADSLRRMLRNRDSIRQAIIIQEIMNRPKCLR